MDSWNKRLEIAVNVSILCAFIMVAALAGQYACLNDVPPPKPPVSVGLEQTGYCLIAGDRGCTEDGPPVIPVWPTVTRLWYL